MIQNLFVYRAGELYPDEIVMIVAHRDGIYDALLFAVCYVYSMGIGSI